MHRRRLVLGIVLVLAMLLGTACAAQPGTPQATQEVASGVVNALEQYLPTVTLPRIGIAYDSQGVPSIFGISTTTIQSLVGIDLSFLQLPPAFVNGFTAQNLQHIELEVADTGVYAYANGNALPYLAWDEASLANLGELIDATDAVQYDTLIRRALPLVQRLGIDLVLHFPRAEGAEAIPVRPRAERAMAMAVEAEPTMIVRLGVDYAADGVPSILGVTTRELQALGVDLSFLELPQSTLDMLDQAGLSSLRLEVQGDGIVISTNGEHLLNLAFSEEQLSNAVDLYGQLYGSGPVTDFAEVAVPLISAMDVDLMLDLPTGQ
jgi:hypothetical protein